MFYCSQPGGLHLGFCFFTLRPLSVRFYCVQPLHQGGFENPVAPACPDSRKRSRLFLFAKVWLYSQTVQSVCPCRIKKQPQAEPIEFHIRSC